MDKKDTIRVAYAEDHPIVKMGVEALLMNYDFITVGPIASNGQEMLDLLEKVEVLPHICIIDISMPVMDGFGLMKELKIRWPEIKTLILTVQNSQSQVMRMIDLGANGYVIKHARPMEIIDAILAIHKSGYFYNDLVDGKMIRTVQSTKMPLFSTQEVEILKLANTEMSYAEMAATLGTSVKSIEGTRYRLFQKLGITNRIGLALYAKDNGF